MFKIPSDFLWDIPKAASKAGRVELSAAVPPGNWTHRKGIREEEKTTIAAITTDWHLTFFWKRCKIDKTMLITKYGGSLISVYVRQLVKLVSVTVYYLYWQSVCIQNHSPPFWTKASGYHSQMSSQEYSGTMNRCTRLCFINCFSITKFG